MSDLKLKLCLLGLFMLSISLEFGLGMQSDMGKFSCGMFVRRNAYEQTVKIYQENLFAGRACCEEISTITVLTFVCY